MSTSYTSKLKILAGVTLCLGMAGCAELTDPYYGGNGYGGGYGYGDRGYGYDPYYNGTAYQDRRERERLERERERLEDERERLERQQRANDYGGYRAPPPPAPRRESCPAGFSPSERKCSSDERRRGCRDIRLPGGLGCVSR